jgi:hypothetical protein
MTLSSSRGNGAVRRKKASVFARHLQRFYWERRRNLWPIWGQDIEADIAKRMNIKDNVPMVICTDAKEYVRIFRKPLKYHVRHVINMRRAAMERER